MARGAPPRARKYSFSTAEGTGALRAWISVLLGSVRSPVVVEGSGRWRRVVVRAWEGRLDKQGEGGSGNGGVANRAVGRDWWDCEIYYLNRFGKVLMALVGKVCRAPSER